MTFRLRLALAAALAVAATVAIASAVVYVVMRNNEYSILKSFAVLEDTPGVPGLDLPGLDIASVARGFGCHAVDVGTADELEHEFKTALSADTATVIVVSTQPQKAML